MRVDYRSGGTKKGQTKDIEWAKELHKEYKERKAELEQTAEDKKGKG